MQLRDTHGEPGENVAEFMRRLADEASEVASVDVEDEDPERFLRGCARAGMFDLEA